MKTAPIATWLLTATLAAIAVPAQAANEDAFAAAKRRGKLIVAMAYLVPEFKVGTKFRTPDAIDSALAEDLAKRLGLPHAAMRTAGKPGAAQPAARADVSFLYVDRPDVKLPGYALISTGYTAGPMAIMRTDTNIKRWEDVKGRTVCLSEGGRYVGVIAARYGAIEQVYRAPADSLINVRIGTCDAAVHDHPFLEALIALPEWKKFSARLPTGPSTHLVMAVRHADAKTIDYLTQVAADWRASDMFKKLAHTMSRTSAFEVYLDQDVPDCH